MPCLVESCPRCVEAGEALGVNHFFQRLFSQNRPLGRFGLVDAMSACVCVGRGGYIYIFFSLKAPWPAATAATTATTTTTMTTMRAAAAPSGGEGGIFFSFNLFLLKAPWVAATAATMTTTLPMGGRGV